MKIKSLKFTNHPILKDSEFNFEIDGNIQEITLLVGENGCGKTIFLEELYKIINAGITLWNDGIDRKLTIILTDEEKNLLSAPSNTLVFDYQESTTANWNRFKIYDALNTDITNTLQAKLQNGEINSQLKCAYSTAEINFSSQKIDSVKATSIDTEEKPRNKSTANLATEIAQLLVDIKAQDDAEAAKWNRENVGKTLLVPEIEGKLDRFKRAYNNLFDGKELCDIRPEEGSQKILFKDLSDNSEFEISKLSTGEKQVIYRVGYLLRNLKTISGGIILIDEPELSLHPKWQIKYISFLRELFTESEEMTVQFVIATHSPYLLKSLPLNSVNAIIFAKESGNLTIQDANNGWSLFRNGPTIGEISYYAFKLPSIEFHNELYGHIQEKELKFTESEIEAHFVTNGIVKNKSWIRLDRAGAAQPAYDVTLMTYIRNAIHHPENTNNLDFTDQEIKESIERMIPLTR